MIAGAGPTGLTLAAELARRHVRVLLVDAALGPFVGSRGKGLQPRTPEVFDNLGLANRLLSLGRFHLPIRFYDGSSSYRDADMSAGQAPTPESPYARILLIAQWRTEAVLRDHLAHLGVTVAWNCGVTGLTQQAQAVAVSLGDGRQVRTHYVVGCDGGSSTVRKLVGARFLGSTDENRRSLLGDFVLEGLSRDHWTICKGECSSIAVCPLPATDSYSVHIHLEPGDTTEPSLAAFQAYIDQLPALRQVKLLEATWLSQWRLTCTRRRAGRA